MENDNAAQHVSTLLGISEPSLLLESVNRRIAFFQHQLQEAGPEWPGRYASARLLVSLERERDEMLRAFARVAAFQTPAPLIVLAKEEA